MPLAITTSTSVRPEGHARPTTAACGILSILGVLAVIGTAVAASRHAISWKATYSAVASTLVFAAAAVLSAKGTSSARQHVAQPLHPAQEPLRDAHAENLAQQAEIPVLMSAYSHQLFSRGLGSAGLEERMIYMANGQQLVEPRINGINNGVTSDWEDLVLGLSKETREIYIRPVNRHEFLKLQSIDGQVITAHELIRTHMTVSIDGAESCEILFYRRPGKQTTSSPAPAEEAHFLTQQRPRNQPQTAAAAIAGAVAVRRTVHAVNYRPPGTQYVERFGSEGLASTTTEVDWAHLRQTIQGHLNKQASIFVRVDNTLCWQVTSIEDDCVRGSWCTLPQTWVPGQAMVFVVVAAQER
jgi:hypothetical protein